MKTVYDGFFYEDQPSLIRRGLRPVYFLYDGVLNRATTPEAGNNVPGAAGAEFAFRRAARDALAVENPGIPQANSNRPKSYDRVESPVVIDLENQWLMSRLYTEEVGPDDDRMSASSWLGYMIDKMRAEAKGYGRDISIGSYCPLLPYANDPVAMASAEADWKPLLDRFDFAAPEAYVHSPDFEKWTRDVGAAVNACKRLLPGRPVYPTLAPHYAHYAEESIRYTPVPLVLWEAMANWVLSQPDVAGVVLWGGVEFFENPDGTKRREWKEAEPYLSAIQAAAKRN